jgi:hypothetical protein
MTTFGKSIRIYLKDGNVTGIRIGEVVNQTIQSVACPRNRLTELSSYDEANKPGVYFLFGKDEETGGDKVYVGESENVFTRIKDHILTKEFWNEAILFTSKDQNLTKAHVRYLENRSIQDANVVKRYITSQNDSPATSLPQADRDAMEEFFTYIKLLLGVFGHKLFEELTQIKAVNNATVSAITQDNQFAIIDAVVELSLSASNVNAQALRTDEGIVVLEGSEVTANTTNSLQNGYKDIRDNLIKNGILKLEDGKYKFQKNYLFDSPSAAAAVIVGHSISGPQTWKDKSGRTLKNIEEESLIPSTK